MIKAGYENNGAAWVFRNERGHWLGEISLDAGTYGHWRTANPKRQGRGHGAAHLSVTVQHVEALLRASEGNAP